MSRASWTVHEGDVSNVLDTLAPNSFDALLSDPPYGLSFMGKAWDHGVPSADVWRQILRVLKPGAPVLAFGGTRTYHRLAAAIEDAGFEIRDCLAWMYGSGFPKSLAVDKAIDAANGDDRPIHGVERRFNEPSGIVSAGRGSVARTEIDRKLTSAASAASAAWDGYGTALKPAFEPIVLARKPLDGTVAANVTTWGVGGLAIDACRVEYASEADQAAAAAAAQRAGQDQNVNRIGYGSFINGAASIPGFMDRQHLGRWPANVLLDEEAAAVLDEQSGDRPGMSGGGTHRPEYGGGMFGAIDCAHTARGDSGGASRFFYIAKADRAERELGCEDLRLRSAAEVTDREDGDAALNSPRSGAGRTGGARNHHPTVKPIALARYLARLILPPPRAGSPRRILVPFSGSGSEMIGAMRAGWEEIHGIEMDPEYAAIARARLARWEQVAEHVENVKQAAEDDRQPSLFSKVGT